MPTVSSDTLKVPVVNWARGELDTLLASVDSLVQDGFGTPEREAIAKDMFVLLRETGLDRSGNGRIRLPSRAYSFQVVFRGQQTDLAIRLKAVDMGLYDVEIESADTALVAAMRREARATYLASLLPIQRVELSLIEVIGQSGQMPRTVLRLASVEEYGCIGFGIAHTLERRADTLALRLHGIDPPRGHLCPSAMSPAVMSSVQALNPGRYVLVVSAGDDESRFILTVTDSSLGVATRRASFAVATEEVRWRYPRNGFALRCSEAAVRRGVCAEVQGWLLRLPGVTRVTFPPGGLNPFGYHPSPRRPDATFPPEPAVFRSANPAAMAAIRRCFPSIEEQIGTENGVTLEIQTATGLTVSTWATYPYRERRVPLPPTVTGTAACRPTEGNAPPPRP
jgi:hypothetical protein